MAKQVVPYKNYQTVFNLMCRLKGKRVVDSVNRLKAIMQEQKTRKLQALAGQAADADEAYVNAMISDAALAIEEFGEDELEQFAKEESQKEHYDL